MRKMDGQLQEKEKKREVVDERQGHYLTDTFNLQNTFREKTFGIKSRSAWNRIQ